jgi:alpha-beta hydrolase superfamily lysophospholipase
MPSIARHVPGADGTDLLVRHWPPDEAEAGGAWAGPPWAHVLLVHGLGEHSGRYEHVGDQLTAAGLDVTAYDHRGMGGSGGRRGDVVTWSQYHDDLAARLQDVRATAQGRPAVLYGHSLGGLIVAGYLLTDRPKPDLVVLTSPALDSTIPGWKRRVAVVAAKVRPTAVLANDIDGATLSRDPSVAAKTVDDPLCVKVSTVRFGAEALAEQARVRAGAPRGFGLPTLVLHGLDDGLVPADASAILEGAPLVERRTYPDLRHELHNEPEGREVIDAIVAWLRQQAVAVPAPSIPRESASRESAAAP